MSTSTPDTLIAGLSWRPGFILRSGIFIYEGLVKPTILPRTPPSSSLGLLDVLPIELLRLVLNSSDFQSLSRFARVCHQAKTLVESLLSYQDIMKHAFTALFALSLSKLIKFHTAATIHAALLSDKCVSCQRYGVFLFLPTCERCCYEFLERERSLRVITIRMAQICFGVSKKDLCQTPMMLSMPDQYLPDKITRSRGRARSWLVSLKQAEKLGLSVHGSQEAMESAGVLRKNRKFRRNARLHARWLTGATLDSEPRLSSILRDEVDSPCDEFRSTASITFPSLRPNGELDNELWCLGCRTTYDVYYHNGILISDSQVTIPDGYLDPDIDLLKVLSGKQCQARSRFEFLEHIKDCKGARYLLRKWGKEE